MTKRLLPAPPILAAAAAVLAALALAVGCALLSTEDAVPAPDPGRTGGGVSAAGEPLALTVMTFNVLVGIPNADYAPWSERMQAVADIIRRHDPDVIGLQEPLLWQVLDIQNLCPGYVAHRPAFYTDAALLYRAERFELLDRGAFWLSPKPDTAFSRGFGNTLPRLAMWVRLRDMRSGRAFVFVNTHFDNTAPFQERAAPLFLERVEEIAGGAPVVAVGDFNSPPTRVAYHTLTGGVAPGGFALTDAYDLAARRVRIAGEGASRPFDPAARIDHIFVAHGDWTSPWWAVDMSRYGDPPRPPSDHFAVVARLVLESRRPARLSRGRAE